MASALNVKCAKATTTAAGLAVENEARIAVIVVQTLAPSVYGKI